MTRKSQSSDKPREPAYPGGEDEGKKSQPQPSDPPADEDSQGQTHIGQLSSRA